VQQLASEVCEYALVMLRHVCVVHTQGIRPSCSAVSRLAGCSHCSAVQLIVYVKLLCLLLQAVVMMKRVVTLTSWTP
jgi:hypothetical protein